ncbi:putative Co/Zn/Cd efflux system membrane fusion protein [Enhygromyxa salina]|uniref:Putative Co/Zn/Cd efflux system membrane fusion protein n=1 Tax=Enhygromyxa salina TaxID=215803 RepID=A0A0C2DD56_9BACT|nr:efflux RND transporter periplasmic adaptor subunit [Enhygromyxa salina]KIG17632.1 putative Co/Zn/Cd efflux system membrane fusion protein [Enhygromyxa salina]
MRYVIAIIGLLLVIGGLVFVKGSQISMLMGMGEAMEQAGPPPEAVSTVPATAQTWEASLQAVGTVASVRGVQISGEVPGVVVRIGFESGALVEAGDVLVELDSRVERAQLAASQVTRDLAVTTARRTRELDAAGVEPQAQLDIDESALRQATAQIEVLRAQIARKVIRAPFAGRLGIREVNLGQYLNAGAAITTLEAVDGAYVDFELPQHQRRDLATGLRVRLSVEGAPELDDEGTIVAIEPSVDPSTRMVLVRALVATPQSALEPGMFVRVEVVLPEQRQVVSVPMTAVVHASYGDSVFVIDAPQEPQPGATGPPTGPDGAPIKLARQQFVQLGERRGDFVAVLDGVLAGEEVVVAGAFKLRNNAPVVVNNTEVLDAKLEPTPQNR